MDSRSRIVTVDELPENAPAGLIIHAWAMEILADLVDAGLEPEDIYHITMMMLSTVISARDGEQADQLAAGASDVLRRTVPLARAISINPLRPP